MKMNRNHFFMIGLIVFLLGLQFKIVQEVQLTRETTKFIEEKIQKKPSAIDSPLLAIFPSNNAFAPKKTFRPPRWLGWSLMSIGAVVILQSFVLRKP